MRSSVLHRSRLRLRMRIAVIMHQTGQGGHFVLLSLFHLFALLLVSFDQTVKLESRLRLLLLLLLLFLDRLLGGCSKVSRSLIHQMIDRHQCERMRT